MNQLKRILNNNVVNRLLISYYNSCATKISLNSSKSYCKSSKDEDNPKLGAMSSKYKPFKEEESEIILDVYEENLKYSNDLLEEYEQEVQPNAFEGINLERGVTGVYDIEDLIDLLKRENAADIFVAGVPPDHNYVDYIVIVTGKSKRHIQAIMEFVRRVYKQKCHKSDLLPKIEGANSNDWMAMDLGNIALHVFSRDARDYYDLDSLWAVGPEFDKEFNKQDEVVDMLEKHTIFLNSLHPGS